MMPFGVMLHPKARRLMAKSAIRATAKLRDGTYTWFDSIDRVRRDSALIQMQPSMWVVSSGGPEAA